MIVLVAVCALGFIGGGVFILLTQQTGPSAQATVTDCPRVGRTAYSCNGTWRAADGRVVRGTIDGVNSGDVGGTVDVRLSGNRAYTTSRRLPLVLIGLGLTLAMLGGIELRNQAKRARHP
jgi:hypothetical protein